MQDTNWKDKRVVVTGGASFIARALKLLNWKPEISLEEGLQKTVNWYINTHKPKGFVDEKLLMERT